jgi:hypothetical protein
MATVNLHPASTFSNDWTISGGAGTVHENLADSTDSSVIKTQDQNDYAKVTLDNLHFSLSGVTIDSVRFYVRGVLFNARSGNTDIQVTMETSAGVARWNETITLNFTGGYVPEDHYGTARTTSSLLGGADWAVSDLDDMRLNINTSPEDPGGASYAQVTKAYVEVTYTEAVTDNSVFFGCNF